MVASGRDLPLIFCGPDAGVQIALDPAGALGDAALGSGIAVTIPDLTRPLDPQAALVALQERISDMRVVVGSACIGP